jgi:pyruvate/2-oxoglutarate/acetoin dehydrogenase E1 component
MREITLIEAIREAYIEEMKADEKVFMIGQDIRGTSWPNQNGLVQMFGEDRIIDTPISETGMFGGAMGAAMMGYRPIVDFMFAGIVYCAASEILQQAAQYYFVHGSKVPLPIVITAAAGAGQKLVNEHSMTPHAFFLHHPGIKVAFASNPYDAKGLMKSAIRDNNPLVLFWHIGLMNDKGPVPEEEYVVPLGVADVKREGTDVTVLATGMMVKHSLQAAQALENEISVEVVDLRSLEPLDFETIMRSLEKTNRMVIVDEDVKRCGFAGELMAQVMEKGFDLLDAPIARVCIENVPIPGGYYEDLVLPNPQKIIAAIRSTMA